MLRVRDSVRRYVDENIAFIHMPKCGGTSLKKALCQRYSPKRQTLLDSGASKRAADSRGVDLLEFRLDLLHYELQRGKASWLIAGHYPVRADTLESFGAQWMFMTVLRDPVDRWLSHYFYGRHKTDSPFHIDHDLATYANSEHARRMGSIYVRHLLTLPGKMECVSDLDVEAAIDVLSRFDLIGTVESMPTWIAQFESKTGQRLRVGQHNASPVSREDRLALVTPELREQVARLCEPDIKVYEAATRMVNRVR